MNKYMSYYKILDDFHIRTPLFSFSDYKRIITKSILKDIDFKKIVEAPLFKEALFLASPELYHQIVKWEKGFLKDAKKIARLQLSILKYFTRISSRCTPFGLFASCTHGSFGLDTSILLQKNESYKRFTRFDTTFLALLVQKLVEEPSIKKQLLFYPNTSIYKIGDHYRYIEYTIENKKRNYSLEGVKYSEFIDQILEKAIKGNTIVKLGATLVEEDIKQEEAEGFIEELIANQILVSELEIPLTDTNYIDFLIKKIKEIPEASDIYIKLQGFKEQLKVIDVTFGNDIEKYLTLTENIKEFEPDVDTKHLFQTDCFTGVHKNTLSNTLQKKLEKVLVVFNKITLNTVSTNIEKFKKEFLNRFEQSEVPLTLVLDPDMGISYSDKKYDNDSMLNNLSPLETNKRYERFVWSDVDSILQKKMINTLKDKAFILELEDKDFESLPTTWTNLPDTFSSIAEIYTNNDKQQIYIKGIGGASATNLIGRFSYGDRKLLEHVNKITDLEAKMNPDKILAEIVHLPEARTGNVIQRPVFRDYEIPYLGKSNVANEKQIAINDILVSVKNDAIILRSKKLDKEILPRLGNAHNFKGNSLPIYQFLSELQTQNKRSTIGFSWNPVLKKQTFLPRVIYKEFIFSKARWNITTSDFKQSLNNNNLFKVNEWQIANLLPDYVELVEGDNKLMINLQNETSVKMLLETVKNKKHFVLEEVLHINDTTIKDKNDNFFRNQFVVSFYNNQKLQAIT